MKKVLQVKDLNISFKTSLGRLNAIRGVNFDLYEGETLAIVGESGSGKSVSTKAIMRILDSNAIVESGEILLGDVDILKMNKSELREIKGKTVAMIFQDPMTSLNPTMKIGKQIMEVLSRHQGMAKNEAKDEAIRLLDVVGITHPSKRFHQYPHQLSGGMRQRVVIAIALGCKPDILIADEPTTALDVTIQAKILNLLNTLQKEYNLSVIFITHDLGVVAKVADRVCVMYAGKIVEYGLVNEIFYEPKHPYTWGLLLSMPDLEIDSDYLYAIPGSPPNLLHHNGGDAFAIRNEYALKIDYEYEPEIIKINDTHGVASWLYHENAETPEIPKELRQRIASMKKLGDLYE